jgi:hypothetical protein
MRPAACHFLLQYRIWHRATRPGFPSARGTRPGLGPDAMPTGLLIRRKCQVAKRVLLDTDRPSHPIWPPYIFKDLARFQCCPTAFVESKLVFYWTRCFKSAGTTLAVLVVHDR